MKLKEYSRVFNKYYDSDHVTYITNFQQVFKYLNASEDAVNYLVDILYSGTRKDCLVFVFEKSPLIKELYRKWNAHELN